jgi:hypothetical protein
MLSKLVNIICLESEAHMKKKLIGTALLFIYFAQSLADANELSCAMHFPKICLI